MQTSKRFIAFFAVFGFLCHVIMHQFPFLRAFDWSVAANCPVKCLFVYLAMISIDCKAVFGSPEESITAKVLAIAINDRRVGNCFVS